MNRTNPPNLYARIEDGRVTQLVMPNAAGALEGPAPKGDAWYAVWWPVNPHDTGKHRIASMLVYKSDKAPASESGG